MSPIVKWLGGKRRIADQIIATFPSAPIVWSKIGNTAAGLVPRKQWRYVEPFLGGASVYLATQAAGHRFEGAFLSDACAPLIDTYRAIIADPLSVAAELRILETVSYTVAKDCFNARNPGGAVERAALFLALNRRGFNGLCRFSERGQFNVPVGDESRPLHTLAELEAFRDAMQGAHLSPTPYDAIDVDAYDGRPAIVYCDPPYVPIKAGSFVGYNAGGFDHAKFARWCHGLAERGVCVRVSNSASDVTRMLYRGFTVIEIEDVKRSVSADAKGRAPVKELLLCAN